MIYLSLLILFIGTPFHKVVAIPDNHSIYATTMYISDTVIDTHGTDTVEDDDGIIYLVDGADNKWVVEEYPEDYFVGDYVSVLLDNNGTTNTIYDDKILQITATGFVR